MKMDINPLIADLKKYQDELIDTIMIAIGFDELTKSDEYVANSIAEIKGEKHSDRPFRQVADLYRLPLEEVINNIRDFTNKTFRNDIMEIQCFTKNIEFEHTVTTLLKQ